MYEYIYICVCVCIYIYTYNGSVNYDILHEDVKSIYVDDVSDSDVDSGGFLYLHHRSPKLRPHALISEQSTRITVGAHSVNQIWRSAAGPHSEVIVHGASIIILRYAGEPTLTDVNISAPKVALHGPPL